MGWRDRDYARWTNEERRRFYGSGGGYPASRAGARAGALPSAFLAVIVSLLVALALGQLPRGHPLISALHFELPALSTPASTGHISLPGRVQPGSYLTLHGSLHGGGTGDVRVEGAYGSGSWRLLAAVPARNGSYEARIRLRQKGLLHLRVTYPDGHEAVGATAVG